MCDEQRSHARYPWACRQEHAIRGPEDEREGRCRLCRIASKRRYEQSVKGRAAQERYNSSAKGRDRSETYEWSSKGYIRRARAELRAAESEFALRFGKAPAPSKQTNPFSRPELTRFLKESERGKA